MWSGFQVAAVVRSICLRGLHKYQYHGRMFPKATCSITYSHEIHLKRCWSLRVAGQSCSIMHIPETYLSSLLIGPWIGPSSWECTCSKVCVISTGSRYLAIKELRLSDHIEYSFLDLIIFLSKNSQNIMILRRIEEEEICTPWHCCLMAELWLYRSTLPLKSPLYIYIYIYIYIRIHTIENIHACTHAYINMCIVIHVYARRERERERVCVCVLMCACVYIYIYVFHYVCVYLYIYM